MRVCACVRACPGSQEEQAQTAALRTLEVVQICFCRQKQGYIRGTARQHAAIGRTKLSADTNGLTAEEHMVGQGL